MKLFTFLLFLTTVSLLQAQELDRIFLPQRSFFSAAFKGLGDAGIAHPQDITAGLINPALVYSCQKSTNKNHGSVSFGYGRDSVYDRHILPIGFNFSTAEGSLGFFYRFLKSENDLSQHDMTMNLSGQMFGNGDQQGPVDFGVNFRYEKMIWKQRPPKTVFLLPEPAGTWITEKIINNDAPGFNSRTDNSRLILDIGFYQKDVWQNTDFGLTLRNLIGYTWIKEHYDTLFTKDTIKNISGIDSVIIEKYHYIAEDHKDRSWISGKYKIIAAGLVYRAELANGSLKLSFPMDIEILGLFDKNMKNRFVFKGGAQAGIGQFLYARIGYARQPGPIQSQFQELKNANVFTGGAGVAISRLKLDFFISKNSFGTSAAFEY